jgi:phospholipase C
VIKKALSFAALAAIVSFTGCSSLQRGGIDGALPAAPDAGAPGPVGKYIKHVVIIVQENRTFDNLFENYPGADTSPTGLTSKGKTVHLKPIVFEKQDMIHDWASALRDWDNGKMDGFDTNILEGGAPAGLYSYSYVKRALTAPYWTMAKQYVLGDHMFATMFGQSYTAHLDLVASTTNIKPDLAVINDPSAQPWGCDAPGGTFVQTLNQHRVITPATPFPCFSQFGTMKDTMDVKHVSWRYYQPASNPLWSAFDSVRNVRYGPDWNANVGKSGTEILTAATSGQLPSVSWVIPDWLNSDHPAAGSDTGPSWVAAVVNEIGQGPDWKSTAIFIVWDDWGSWYDNVPPPQLSFVGLGMRVPVLVVSPYAKKGYVSHTQYEFGSILKFTELAFNLKPIGPPGFGYTDTRANPMLDAFDFTQAPRAFKKIPAKYPTSYFLKQTPSGKPTDDY